MKGLLAIAMLLALAACGGGGGGGGSTVPPPPVAPAFTDPLTYSTAATASLASPNEITAVTRHQLAVGGTTLNYTATVGHMSALARGTALPEASFFYVAYTLDGRDPATRPVTFFYNGGPGSATVWLHLGSFGPKRLAANAPSTTTPAPFPFVDNAETLLDLTDLVFVDAVGSGLSQAIAPNVNRTFWSVDADAAVFRDFVMRYVAVNARAASPKFLFGESYGTARTAVLANLLESAGVSLKGVILQSSVLNYNSNCSLLDTPTVSCAGFLPSYAAIGAWLNIARPSPPPPELPASMAQMRTFASSQYDPAARAFLVARAPPDANLVVQLSNFTGMGAAHWQSRFNMDSGYFHDNLLPGTVIGFYDGRMTALRGTALAAEDDPSSTFINGSFAATITQYLGELGYTTPSSYVMLSNAIRNWDFGHDGLPLPDTIPDLAAAMAHNPTLKVLSLHGYHDIVTPFYATELDLARMGANANIRLRSYQGGHMTYLDDVARRAQKADMAAFYPSALAAPAAVPSAPTAAPAPTQSPRRAGSAMPPATMETKLRGPWIPEALRKVAPAPPTQGEELRAQVERKLRAPFEEASAKRGGALTREEASEAGLGYVARHFDAIDTRRTGSVTFEDLKRFMREGGAQLTD